MPLDTNPPEPKFETQWTPKCEGDWGVVITEQPTDTNGWLQFPDGTGWAKCSRDGIVLSNATGSDE